MFESVSSKLLVFVLCFVAAVSPQSTHNKHQTENVDENNVVLVDQPDDVPETQAVCSMPSETGPCTNYSVRWHYDSLAGECTRFWYGGCDGNGNRFATQSECRSTCVEPHGTICQLPRDPGPCTGQERKYYFDAQTRRCEEFMYSGCQGNGNKFSSLSECERTCHELLVRKEVDPCTQPEDAGRCLAYMQRWFFDQSDGYCKQFIYGGCEGNSNRFETEAECRQTCNAHPPIDICTLPPQRGRCLGNNARFYFDPVTRLCSDFIYGGCEGNDNNFETIEECQKTCSHLTGITIAPTIGRCEMQREPGPCVNYMTRWFFNTNSGQCEPFTYGGCQGNRNKFLTEQECRAECGGGDPEVVATDPPSTPAPPPSPVEPSEDICSMPSHGGDCAAYQILWYYDKDRGRCLQFVYTGCGGNANRFESQEECEGRCHGQTPYDPSLQVTGLAICGLPAETGMCEQNLPKWHYDTDSGTCKQFIYSGCEGNYNNFNTREECESHCPVINICHEVADTGPCRAAVRKYYFDATANECRPFTYGGCAGNANRFSSMEACQRVCQPQPPEPEPDRNADPCTLSRDTGPCTAYYPSWYYDVTERRCLEFVYGGCGGNYNRFNDRETCEQRCGSIRVEPEDPQEPDPYQPDRPVDPHQPVEPERPIDPYAPVEPSSDICNLQKDPGPCQDFTAVWYFEPSRRQCRRFLYGGCDGNGNRFNSRDECESSCLNTERQPQPVEPPIEPVRPTPQTPLPTAYPPYEPTEPIGEPEEHLDVCQQPKRSGPCEALSEMWYFDQVIGTCLRFNYGGCDGNDNRFTSAEECYSRCGGQPPENKIDDTHSPSERCRSPVDSGPCYAAILMFYFDDSIGECRPFTYGGCQGNENKFETQDDCYKTCGQDGRDYKIVTPGDCYEPQDAGTGYEYEARWSFNADKAQCEPFYFTLQGGNRNNFHAYEDCLAMCVRGASVPCRPLACDLQCPFGFKQGEDGCPICQCEDPCERYDCRVGEECVLEEVQCVTEPCLPVPTCRPIDSYGGVKLGFCPEVDSNALGICTQECGSDSECVGTQKCCSNGCGTYCTEPEQPENKPGFCPLPDDRMRTVCDNLCYSDATCPDERKCCWTGCGSVCMSPSSTSYGNDEYTWITTAPQIPAGPTTRAVPTRDWQPPTPYPDPYNQENDRNRDHYEPTEGPITRDWRPPTPHYPYDENRYEDHDRDHDQDNTIEVNIPEETPYITSTGPSNVDAAEGSIVVLPCEVRAAPAAVITWHKDGRPLAGLFNEKIRMLDGGALEIADVTGVDSATYTCRAFNGVGDGATREYTLRVNTRVRFADVEQSADVTVAERGSARLTCAAEGFPQPRIRWLHNGRDILFDGLRIFLEEDGSTLTIADVDIRDEGEYTCEAHNGVSEPVQRTMRLRVQGQIYAQIVAHNTTFKTGDEVHLKCRVQADGNYEISWLLNGQPLAIDPRISHPKPSQLLIKGVTTDDRGIYTCVVTRDQNQVSVDSNIEVEGLSLPINCIDKPWYANCALIVQAEMCKHIYFSDFCCKSCHEAGQL